MLVMLLTIALMTIVALAALPDMIFELKRDQEEEMIHRGVQYTRAIRIYYKKFGRYPTRLEDLENTNDLRYLRKRYKDPLTGKDFKLLHFGDPGLQLGGSLGGGTIPGATPAGAMNANGANGSAFGGSTFGGSGSSSGFGGSSFGGSGFGGSSFGGSNGVNSNGIFSQSSSSSFAAGSNSGFGNNSSNSNSQTNSNQPQEATSGTGSDSSRDASAGNGESDSSSGEQQVIASGPIVGVASLSKDKTIRIFNKKTKYNEWQFIYDPTADMGGLIRTPYQPPLQTMMNGSLQPQNGQNGSSSGNGSSFGGSSFGQSSGFGSSGFGQSSGFGNNSNSNGSGSSSSNQQQ
jgi:type II secretory pathway pseudopilin PulG